MLASVLSSTGALVELQAPCLSGSVLALLLDYIYTGALPCSCTQQQYCNLLTAARHLQMDKLQEALCAWQETEVNITDKTNTSTGNENQTYENIISSERQTADTFNKYLPLTCSIDARRNLEDADTCSVQRTARSVKRVKVDTYAETKVHSASLDPCVKEAETDTCGASCTTGANDCSGKDAGTLGGNTCSMSESSGNTGNCRHVTHGTLQNVIQNTSSTTEGYGVSRVDKDKQKDQFHSAGTIKPETWQNTTDEEIVRTDEGTRSSSSPSSSLPHPCCGAVPVICHSSRAAMHSAQMSTMPAFHAVSQASVDSSRAPPSRSASSENEITVEGRTTEQKKHYDLEDLDYTNKRDHTGRESWDSNDGSDQCASQDLCYRSNMDQSDTAYKEHLGDDSVLKQKVCNSFIREVKYSLDDLPSKHQRPDMSVGYDVSMAAAAEQHADNFPLPVKDSDTRSDPYCEDFCPKREAKEEHIYTSKCSAETDRRNSNCNVYRPTADWYPRLNRAETNTQDAASGQHEIVSDTRDTATEDNPPKSNLDDVTGQLSAFEANTSLDFENISDSESSEPHFSFTIPADGNMSDPMYSAVGQSYHGHVHYHCVPQEDTLLLHGDSDHKYSHQSYPDSDQFSEEEETIASTGHSPLRQHFSMGATDQFLLLDISTKHAELLVSYKHRADQENKGIAFDKNTFGTEIRDNNREQRNEATSGVDKRNTGAMTTFGPECFDEAWKSVGREQSRSRAEVKNKAGVMVEVSKLEEGENQTSTSRVCSAPTVPESAQASMSSTLSVCIPSTLPASMSTNISAHLSTPVHQAFQCSLCDRSFSQRGSLNRHVRSHLGVRPFPCPRCPMTFSRQYRVTEHMRVHQRCTLGNDFPHPPASSI